MSFYDTIATLFEKFMGDNKSMCDHIMRELFDIEADINKLYTIKKKSRRIQEDIDVIFEKHLVKNAIFEVYKAKFQELKRYICDVYKSQNAGCSRYYDELIKIDKYIIGE
jgi:hypothetical protein